MTATPEARELGTYVAPNSWDHARRRLDLLEQCFDPTTIRRLEATGIGPGWQCLEVGGGGGSITRWLCDRVGPEGRVTALDIDTRFLAVLDYPNLEVHQQDVVTQPPPVAAFDLVHTRAVLAHLPARDAVLSDLVAALRPGGWLVIEEPDDFPVGVCGSGVYRDFVVAIGVALAPAGTRLDWARHVPARLDALGLVEVVAEAEVEFAAGGSVAGQFWALSMEQARDVLLTGGCSESDLAAAMALFTDPSQRFPNIAMVGARGRRPTRTSQ